MAGEYTLPLGGANNQHSVIACDAGYRCPGDGTRLDCGTAATEYCAAGASTAATAGTGTYTTPENGAVTNREAVSDCPQGARLYCVSRALVALLRAESLVGRYVTCPPRHASTPRATGSYCVDGIRALCPAGKYGNAEKLSAATCSGDCQAGYFCAAGSTSSTAAQCGADASFYCPAAATSVLTADAGYYTIDSDGGVDDVNHRVNQVECPAGSACASGVQTACVAGWYTSSTQQSSCAACPAGSYCAGPPYDSALPCPAGTFSTGGSSTAACEVCGGVGRVVLWLERHGHVPRQRFHTCARSPCV